MINGCPRRMITDRTYLKAERQISPMPPRIRVRGQAIDMVPQIDTIISHGTPGDRTQ